MKNLIVEGWRVSKKQAIKELRKEYPRFIHFSQIHYRRGNITIFFPEKDLTDQQVFHLTCIINAELRSLSTVRAVLKKK